jgi:hypothetical protein
VSECEVKPPVLKALAEIVAEQFPYGLETAPGGVLVCRKTETRLEYGLDDDEAAALVALVNKYA